jgi:coenzyme F420-reducing hydrogenase delta subunit
MATEATAQQPATATPPAAQSDEAAAAQAAAAEQPPARPREWPEGQAPEIIVFACHYCAYAAADLAGSMRLQYPPTIRIIKLPCTGKLEVIHVLKALEAGADGVYAAGCMEGECHYLKGNLWARKRIGYVKKLLEEMGLEPERVEMYNMSSAMGPRFAEVANEFTERIRALGPSPLRSDDVSPVEAAHAAVAGVGGEPVTENAVPDPAVNVEEGNAQ